MMKTPELSKYWSDSQAEKWQSHQNQLVCGYVIMLIYANDKPMTHQTTYGRPSGHFEQEKTVCSTVENHRRNSSLNFGQNFQFYT
jgi:hypothetical protein